MELESKFIVIFTLIGLLILIPFVASTFQTSYQNAASLSPTAMLLDAAGPTGIVGSSLSDSDMAIEENGAVPSMKKSSLGPDSYETVLQTPYGKFTVSISFDQAVYILEDHEKKLVLTEKSDYTNEFFSTADGLINNTLVPGKEVEEFSNAFGWIKNTREDGEEETVWYGGNFSLISSEYERGSSLFESQRVILNTLISEFSMPSGSFGNFEGLAASGIYINEFMANPGPNNTEWIELYNNLSSSVDLAGWSLDDNGGSTAFTIPNNISIPGKGFLLFYANVTKISLNNNGDSVRLFDNSRRLADSVTYASSQANVSLGRVPDSGNWVNLTISTPGASNS
jgi:hypothetical protein